MFGIARLMLLTGLLCLANFVWADRVTVGTFDIDKTEVTVAEFAEFTNAVGLVTAAYIGFRCVY